MRPSLGSRDRELMGSARTILGIDEVGRGSLAGPVVVCGALFDELPANPDIQDSKCLSPRRREAAARWLRTHAADWLIVEVWPELIDRLNILQATILAMRTVLETLRRAHTAVVVDGTSRESWGPGIHHVARADGHFFCVAAASILAKVHRDTQLRLLASSYPEFGWEKNKGYGSLEHRRALQEHGRSFLHRRSFGWSPVLP